MSNTEIARCQNCGHLYCIECSKNKGWQMFCSDECENEYNDELKNISRLTDSI